MVTVRISETYDLSTKVNKMGIVGIHTPTGSLLARMWGGLALHHKKFRFVKCDIAMACASMLPADPLQVGVEAGSIAPQDMFNPILYTAVSNDSMTNLMAYVQSYRGGGADSVVDKGSIIDINDAAFTDGKGGSGPEPSPTPSSPVDQFSMYYSLLADTNNWRKAMPQAGLVMKGLYPLVYSVVSQYGANSSIANPLTKSGQPFVLDDPAHGIPAPDDDFDVTTTILSNMFRGPSMRMPAIDCTYFQSKADAVQAANTIQIRSPVLETGDSNVFPFVGSNLGSVPPAYVALIILPPAKLNQLYYRLKVTWTVEFTGLRSLVDIGQWANMADIGNFSYGTDYGTQSASMSTLTSMVDADGATVDKIMEGL